MSYSPAELIRFNLAQLRKHMLTQGCTAQQWRSALIVAAVMEDRPGYRQHAPRDPENLDPMGPQNHEVGR